MASLWWSRTCATARSTPRRLEPLFKLGLCAPLRGPHLQRCQARASSCGCTSPTAAAACCSTRWAQIAGADFSQWRDIAPGPARRIRRAHHARRRGRPAHFGDVRQRAGALEQRHRRRGHRWASRCRASASSSRPRAGARRCTSGCTSVAGVLLLALIVSVWLVRPFGLIADYVRYVRAQRRFSLPRLGRQRAGRPRRRLRRDARRAGRPQLRRRLRADPHARGQEPAVGDPRRGRTAAGARHAAGPSASASWPTSRARRSASRRWSTA